MKVSLACNRIGGLFIIPLITLLMIMANVTLCFADSSEGETLSKTPSNTPSKRTDGFKVIGFYCGEWFDVPVEKLQAEKLTHVMYGFLMPTENGGCKPFEEPEQINQLIEKCHSVGTQVFVSVGGYSEKDGTPLVKRFEKISADDQMMEMFIKIVMDIVDQFSFDGVELDWEYPWYKTSGGYEKMVARLAEKLHPLGKGLSTAVAGTGSTDGQWVFEGLDAITDKTYEYMDFISLMCYDQINEPNHSPIDFSIKSINFMRTFKNMARP